MPAVLISLAVLWAPVLRLPSTLDVCAMMPAEAVQTALNESGLRATVTSTREGFDACTYTFSDQGIRLMIDVVLAASPQEAAAALVTLREGRTSLRALPGVADDAFLVDEGPYGRISVTYRAGAAYGKVTLRANDDPAREAAVIAVARAWGERAARAAAPAPVAERPPVAEPVPEPEPAPPPVATATPPSAAPRPPLPPLRWADPDSAARARGFVPWTDPPALPTDVPLAVAALRLLFPAAGADTLLGPGVLEAVEAQAREAAAWSEEHARRDRERAAPDSSTGFLFLRPLAPASPLDPGAAARSGPHAPDEPGLAAPEGGTPTSQRPPPQWYREESTLAPDPIPGPDGLTATVRGERLSFQEPWVTGHDQTIEIALTKTAEDVTATMSYGWREGSTVGLCPDADGLVTGTATGESFFEVSGQAGSRPFRVHMSAAATSEVTARVGDDAVLHSYDLFTTVTTTFSRTSSGGDYPMHEELTSQIAHTGIDAGVRWQSDSWGNEDRLEGLSTPEGIGEWISGEILEGTEAAVGFAVGFALSFGQSAARDGLERAFRNWWDGGCQEVRLAEAPVRTRLRYGESAPFELEVWHYQDEAMTALPVEVTQPTATSYRADQQRLNPPRPGHHPGEVTPERSGESPARFTYTAPDETDGREWQESEVRSRSVSRRGRSDVFDGPTFKRRTGREQYLVMARTRVTASRLGTVQNVTFMATLETDPNAEISGTLRADGGLHGTLVSHDANCLDGYDIPPSTETLSGDLNAEDAASVLEVGGNRRLLLSLTAALPPRDGLERGIAFSWLEGVPLPPAGSTEPVTLRKTLPHGFTGVMQECAGEVQTVYEVTVMPMGDG